MKNEDTTLVLKSTTSTRKKHEEEKRLPLKHKVERAYEILKKFHRNSTKDKIAMSFCRKITVKVSKLYIFVITMIIIILIHYFFTYWHLVPFLESSKVGLTFKFYSKYNWEDAVYRKGIILFLLYHVFLFFFLISLLRTILCNPGFFEKEYLHLYSILKYIKNLFYYCLSYREFNFHISQILNNDNSSTIEDVEFILRVERVIKDKIKDSSFSIALSKYRSVDVTKKCSEIEEDKDKQSSQTISDDAVLGYENEFENYVTDIPIYQDLRLLNFLDTANQCRFCLTKKPDRAHHCRQCKKCIRKMDHHCLYLYTCIGGENHKFFVLTLLYSEFLLLFICINLIDSLAFYISEYGDNFILVVYAIVYILLAVLTISMTSFSFFHIQVLFYNITTIEQLEKQNESYHKIENNIFYMGIYENICQTMGNPFLWLIPIAHSHEYSNYSYPINPEVQSRILKKEEEKKLEPKLPLIQRIIPK